MKRVYTPYDYDVISDLVFDGMTIMSGGFGVCGIPEHAIEILHEMNVRNLTIISNECGANNLGLAILLSKGQISKIYCSYIGNNDLLELQMQKKQVEVEFVPQGTLAERIRIGGAGIPAFYSPTGVGTFATEGKEIKSFNGQDYALETALKADLALIKAWKSDEYGNLVYRKTARNFNPIMAMAATNTIAEVEEVVKVMDPDQIHTPGIFIDRLILGRFKKSIEKLTIQGEKE